MELRNFGGYPVAKYLWSGKDRVFLPYIFIQMSCLAVAPMFWSYDKTTASIMTKLFIFETTSCSL